MKFSIAVTCRKGLFENNLYLPFNYNNPSNIFYIFLKILNNIIIKHSNNKKFNIESILNFLNREYPSLEINYKNDNFCYKFYQFNFYEEVITILDNIFSLIEINLPRVINIQMSMVDEEDFKTVLEKYFSLIYAGDVSPRDYIEFLF